MPKDEKEKMSHGQPMASRIAIWALILKESDKESIKKAQSIWQKI